MSDKPQLAEKHSMDIPHVTSIEFPLNVKNPERAISMIGGKQKITKAINAQPVNTRLNLSMENTLELRLRNDPFHHPIQSLMTNDERILMKVSIPKNSLPPDYYENPQKYSIKELLERNQRNKRTPKTRVQPVAIIDRIYLFKAIADFQISTKNNKFVQDFNNSVLNGKSYASVSNYMNSNKNFIGLDDYKDEHYVDNTDHQFPPPPVLSPIRFPFDYRYQKNPLTTAVKDLESGEIKVVPTRDRLRLYTKMIEYHKTEIPTEAAPELIENLKNLRKRKLPSNSPDLGLLQCIDILNELFETKPIWLRKQLRDIVPDDLGKYIKLALPYISYIYKSGPWRFCNIKFGYNPKNDPTYWIHQSEYFRIPGLNFSSASRDISKKIVPQTIIETNKQNNKTGKNAKEYEIPEHMFFNGVTLPSTVTYQIGDILDLDINTIIEDHRQHMGSDFLRETCDFQDGWINRQTMEVIRRIIRYKLNRMVKEEPIDQNKIYKIINTDYVVAEEEVKEDEDEAEGEGDEAEDVEMEGDDDDIDVEVQEEALNEEEDEDVNMTVDETGVLNKLDQLSIDASKKLSNLIGFIKQDTLES